jgi:hypothetical protein
MTKPLRTALNSPTSSSAMRRTKLNVHHGMNNNSGDSSVHLITALHKAYTIRKLLTLLQAF